MKIQIHTDLATLSQQVAQRIADLAAQAIAMRGEFHLALAGGSTPRRCYEYLRLMPLDWAHVHIYFGDERCLPEGDKERNDTMAHEALLRHVAIPQANVHCIPAQLGAVAAAIEYAGTLKKIDRLDLVLLGLGEDGHTASLFPGNPANDRLESVVAVFDAPKAPPERVSLGIGTLNAAREKWFLISGAGKHEALQQIEQGRVLPAAQVIGAEWHVDRAAWPDAHI